MTFQKPVATVEKMDLGVRHVAPVDMRGFWRQILVQFAPQQKSWAGIGTQKFLDLWIMLEVAPIIHEEIEHRFCSDGLLDFIPAQFDRGGIDSARDLGRKFLEE